MILGWPFGTYGLPKAISGCPKSLGKEWSNGWMQFVMEKDAPHQSNLSYNFHMDARLDASGNINRSFCVKTNRDSHPQLWPNGNYS